MPHTVTPTSIIKEVKEALTLWKTKRKEDLEVRDSGAKEVKEKRLTPSNSTVRKFEEIEIAAF